MKHYYKMSSGKIVELERQYGLYLYSKNIVELIVPDGCEYVTCEDNQLTELILPDGCKYIYCENNQLKELIVLDGCKEVYCYNNQLKELVVPVNCGWFCSDMKSVTELNKVNYLNLII